MEAAQKGHEGIVKVLVGAGASVEVANAVRFCDKTILVSTSDSDGDRSCYSACA